MATKAKFTENELKVLKAFAHEMQNCTGGYFGRFSNVDRLGFTKHVFFGYVSSLQNKGCFSYIGGEVFKNRFSLKDPLYKMLTN
jgi:hypothetical protein